MRGDIKTKDTQMSPIQDSIAALLDREIKYEAQKNCNENTPTLSVEDVHTNVKSKKYCDVPRNILPFTCVYNGTPFTGNTRKNICRWMYKVS